MVTNEGTVKVLQVLHRGKTSRCHAYLDLLHGLPSYRHQDVEAAGASEAEVDDNIDVLSVPGTPRVQRVAKRRAETRMHRLAERIRPAPRDVHAQRVATEDTQRAREARKAGKRSDDEGSLNCALLFAMS